MTAFERCAHRDTTAVEQERSFQPGEDSRRKQIPLQICADTSQLVQWVNVVFTDPLGEENTVSSRSARSNDPTQPQYSPLIGDLHFNGTVECELDGGVRLQSEKNTLGADVS